MSDLSFEWDEKKSRVNQIKHGVSFEEASTVFFDSNAKLIPDLDHSVDEERFILLGISTRLKVLVVCHCYRSRPDIIRIISARKASKFEENQYAGGSK